MWGEIFVQREECPRIDYKSHTNFFKQIEGEIVEATIHSNHHTFDTLRIHVSSGYIYPFQPAQEDYESQLDFKNSLHNISLLP